MADGGPKQEVAHVATADAPVEQRISDDNAMLETGHHEHINLNKNLSAK